MSGPFSVSGGGGSVEMGASASVQGQIAAVNPDGTYDVRTAAEFMGVSYFRGIQANRLRAA